MPAALRADVRRHDRRGARRHRDDQVGPVRDQAVHVLRVDRRIEHRGEDGDLRALLLEAALDAVRPGGTEGVLVRADDDADLLAVEAPSGRSLPARRRRRRPRRAASAASGTQRNDLRLMSLRPFRSTIDERPPRAAGCVSPDEVGRGGDGRVRQRQQCIRSHTTCPEAMSNSGHRALRLLRRPRRPRACRGGRARPGRRGARGGSASPDSIRSMRRVAAARTHLGERLPDGRQAEPLPPGHVDVVEADDRQLGGYADADAPRRVERTERDDVVRGEHGRRPRLGGEEVEAPLVAAAMAELSDTTQALVERDARCLRAARGSRARDPGSSSCSRARR